MDELRKGKITLLPVENLSIIRETTLIYQRDFSHKAVLDEIVRLYYEVVRLYRT